MFFARLPLSVLLCIAPFCLSLIPVSTASIFQDLDLDIEAGDDAPYLEEGGVIVIEAESLLHESDHWSLETAIDGFSGTGYLVGKTNTFNKGGLGKISYPIQVGVSGVYQLNWKGRITMGDQRGEHNDAFARVLDEYGNVVAAANSENEFVNNTNWYKVFMNRLDQWSYDSKNVDHVGISIAWELEAGKAYVFEVSVRSEGFGLDRMVLWNRSQHSFGNTESGRVANEVPMDALAESARNEEIDTDNDGLLDSYEMEHGGLSLDPALDLDRDGMVAGLEFVMGTDPHEFNRGGTFSFVEENGNQYLTYDYTKASMANPFYRLVPRFTVDLSEWESESAPVEVIAREIPAKSGLSHFRAKLPADAFEESGFFHLLLERHSERP